MSVLMSVLLTQLSLASPLETGELLDKIKALEIFLEDQKNHDIYCPEIGWEQPDITVYREKLESQLPDECPVPKKEEEK